MDQRKYTVEEIGAEIRKRFPNAPPGVTDRDIGLGALERDPNLSQFLKQEEPARQSPGSLTGQSGQKNGLLEMGKGMLKGMAAPFVKAGVTGVSAVDSAVRLKMGDVEGANRTLLEGYNVPGFGRVRPVGGGTVDQRTGRTRFQTGTENLRDVVGTGADIGSTIAIAPGASNAVKTGMKETAMTALKQGIKHGAAVGATGAVGRGLQDQGASAADIAKEAAIGAVSGGLVGGVVGPLLNRVGAYATKAGREAMRTNKAAGIVSPKMTDKVYKEALSQGRVTEPGLFRAEKVLPGEFEKRVAKSAAPYVKPGATPQANINSLRKAVGDISEKEIKPFLQKHNSPFDPSEIEARLSKVELPDLFKADTTINNALELAKKRMMDKVRQSGNTLEGLWEARKAFDNEAERQFPRIFGSDSSSALQNAIKEMRLSVNDFIDEKAAQKGGMLFKARLRKLSDLYEAMENVADKAGSEKGMSLVQRFAKNNPTTANIVKRGLQGGAALLGVDYLKRLAD